MKHLAIAITTSLFIGSWISHPNHVFSQTQQRLVITGQVVDQDGRPVSHASVFAFPDQLFGRLPSAVADGSGKFSIEVDNGGRYRLTAGKFAEQYANLASTLHYPSPAAMPEVNVGTYQPTAFVMVKLGPRAGTLTGSLVDAETQESIARFQIRVCRLEGPRYCHQESFAGNSGRFQMLVPSTPIFVEAFADGYRDWQRTDESKQKPTPVVVESGQISDLTVQLTKVGAPVGLPKRLEAPRPVAPANGTEFDHYPRVTKLEWSAVPGAEGYAVEIDFCDGLVRKECHDPSPLEGTAVPPTSGIQGTSYQFPFVGAQPGRWRVWAVDAQGWAGAKSDWSWFVYRR